jgi:hypothetical protein
VGVRYRIDVRSCAKRASELATKRLAEDIAAAGAAGADGLPPARVQAWADPADARILVVNVQTRDPWADAPLSPAVAGPEQLGRSVLDGPFRIGRDPENSKPLLLEMFTTAGGVHTMVVAATGGGKTTVFSNVVEQATGCRDVLVMAVERLLHPANAARSGTLWS